MLASKAIKEGKVQLVIITTKFYLSRKSGCNRHMSRLRNAGETRMREAQLMKFYCPTKCYDIDVTATSLPIQWMCSLTPLELAHQVGPTAQGTYKVPWEQDLVHHRGLSSHQHLMSLVSDPISKLLFSHQRPHLYMLDALLERAKKCSGVCHRFMDEVLDRACDVKAVDVDGGKSRALFCAGHFIKGSLLIRGIGIEEDFKGCVAHMRAAKDTREAMRWYRLAASRGNTPSVRSIIKPQDDTM
ncbi:hypothetical protein Pelo_17569 [Pelomyxa schiedti]|nr:hypothetical protein Pelo_17569 [Pelomyxa schiedti]